MNTNTWAARSRLETGNLTNNDWLFYNISAGVLHPFLVRAPQLELFLCHLFSPAVTSRVMIVPFLGTMIPKGGIYRSNNQGY